MPKSEKFQAPQRGRRRWKKVVSGFALLHHQHHQPGGLDRHLQRHHDLVGLLKQQLLKHSSALTLAYPTQVIGLSCAPLRRCHNTKSLQFFLLFTLEVFLSFLLIIIFVLILSFQEWCSLSVLETSARTLSQPHLLPGLQDLQLALSYLFSFPRSPSQRS